MLAFHSSADLVASRAFLLVKKISVITKKKLKIRKSHPKTTKQIAREKKRAKQNKKANKIVETIMHNRNSRKRKMTLMTMTTITNLDWSVGKAISFAILFLLLLISLFHFFLSRSEKIVNHITFYDCVKEARKK